MPFSLALPFNPQSQRVSVVDRFPQAAVKPAASSDVSAREKAQLGV